MQLILVPTFLLSFMTLAIFWIPPYRPDRTAMCMGLFSSFLLLLIIVVNSSPPTAAAKLGQYYIIVIVMVALSIFLSIVNINIHQCTRPFPAFMERLIIVLRCCMGIADDSSLPENAAGNNRPLTGNKRPLKDTEKWCLLAIIMDRLYFVCYLTVLILTLVFVFPRKG